MAPPGSDLTRKHQAETPDTLARVQLRQQFEKHSSGEAREHIVMSITLKMIVLLSALWYTFGCVAAEPRRQNRAIQAENRRVYEIYQQYMQSMNAQREMSGIPPPAHQVL